MFRLWFQSLKQHFRHRIPETIGQSALTQRNQRILEKHYQASSTASIEVLWQKINNLADLASWHPLITSTNAPNGQQAKPGLIYRVFALWVPVPIIIFVESVLPVDALPPKRPESRPSKKNDVPSDLDIVRCISAKRTFNITCCLPETDIR